MSALPDVRAVDHIGITVPSIDDATNYFREVFGAVVLWDLLEGVADGALPPEVVPNLIGIRADDRLTRMRLLRLGAGPSLELFEFSAPVRSQPSVPSDFGLQHLGIYVDDIARVSERVRAAGGTLFVGPLEMISNEAGDGNQWWYTRTPWGMTIELLTYPTAPEPANGTSRWRPPVGS